MFRLMLVSSAAAVVSYARLTRRRSTTKRARRRTQSNAHSDTRGNREANSGHSCAPDDVTVSGGVFAWRDNSNNEDGFDILFQLCSQSFAFTVPANTTSFPIPPQVQSQLDCPCGCRSVEVTAFNAGGRMSGSWAGPCATARRCCQPLPSQQSRCRARGKALAAVRPGLDGA